MYWGQVAVALVGALVSASYLYSLGWTATSVVLVAIVVYFVARWLIAIAYRVRYWYRRGTKGHYSRGCPDCGQYIYRRRRDWILRCDRCGWIAGRPVVRWITQSVPGRQFRRTVIGPQLVIVVLAVFALTGGASVDDVGFRNAATNTTVPNASVFADPIGEPTRAETDVATEAPVVSSELDVRNRDTSIENERVERLIINRTNQVRRNHQLSTLSRGDVPSRFAEQHSRDMGEYGFFSHNGPNGTSARQRMERIGQSCGGPASENVHRAPLVSNVRIYGSEETVNVYDESELAVYAVQGWMNSPGHRENMLDNRWTRTGVGVYVSEETVYITIVFC